VSKRVLYLSFYFEPDLCAGSFRNTPLIYELAKQLKEKNYTLDVITTQPNRYRSFDIDAPLFEEKDNLSVFRAVIPKHKSGFIDQALSFISYFKFAIQKTRGQKYDLVIASSSRLFTAFLGWYISRKKRSKLYLDIRDIFTDTMNDVLKTKVIRFIVMPFVKLVEKVTFRNADHINLISQGFEQYFISRFPKPAYSFYSNGIDQEFINLNNVGNLPFTLPFVITYAGNIGEGQGLHKILPKAAKRLGDNYKFLVIGDGGARQMLETEIRKQHINNVEIRNPVKRKELIELYSKSHFLFIHLNDYKAFEKVLPSKIFELGALDKPIIAGVGGYAAQFLLEEVDNLILFDPGNAEQLVESLNNYDYKTGKRIEFINKYKRENINSALAASMMNYL
jgi:hypothetical protein